MSSLDDKGRVVARPIHRNDGLASSYGQQRPPWTKKDRELTQAELDAWYAEKLKSASRWRW